jgi:hypothetical protein
VAARIVHQLRVDRCYGRGLALGEVLGVVNHCLPLHRRVPLVRRSLTLRRFALHKRAKSALPPSEAEALRAGREIQAQTYPLTRTPVGVHQKGPHTSEGSYSESDPRSTHTSVVPDPVSESLRVAQAAYTDSEALLPGSQAGSAPNCFQALGSFP